MPQIKIEIKNLDKFVSALSSYPGMSTGYLNTAIKKSIFEIRKEAVPRTPVDTGRLRGSYNEVFSNLYGSIEPVTKYSAYVEFGTRKMRAQPYLTPGVESALGQIENYFKEELNKAMEEIARKSR